MSQIHFCISSSYLNDDSNIICSVRNSLLSLKPPLVTENDPLDNETWYLSLGTWGVLFPFLSTVVYNFEKNIVQLVHIHFNTLIYLEDAKDLARVSEMREVYFFWGPDFAYKFCFVLAGALAGALARIGKLYLFFLYLFC